MWRGCMAWLGSSYRCTADRCTWTTADKNWDFEYWDDFLGSVICMLLFIRTFAKERFETSFWNYIFYAEKNILFFLTNFCILDIFIQYVDFVWQFLLVFFILRVWVWQSSISTCRCSMCFPRSPGYDNLLSLPADVVCVLLVVLGMTTFYLYLQM